MKRKLLLISLLLFIVGLFCPQSFQMPVEGATHRDYNRNSFWYFPWGKSVTHKGIDIFAKAGTNIRSSTMGLVLLVGQNGMGGNTVLILGPKWRLHYYAHLQHIEAKPLQLVGHTAIIGKVGSSGNAAGKSPHLHYSILSLVPYPWRIDEDVQGWKKMFYLNPMDYF